MSRTFPRMSRLARLAFPSLRVLLPAALLVLALPLGARAETESEREARVPRRVNDPTVMFGTPVPLAGSGVVHLEELARRERLVPASVRPPVRILDHPELIENEGDVPEPDIFGPPPAPLRFLPRNVNIAGPPVATSFPGLDDIPMVDSSYIIIPPDVNGAVGPSKIFQNLNNNVRILNKADGAVLSTVGVNTFWAPTGASPNNFTDPRTVYEPYNGRFVTIMQGDLNNATGNSLVIGISDSNDPGGTWHLYRTILYLNATSAQYDFPTLGFNKNWITVSINRYNSGGALQGNTVVALHYPSLLANTFTAFRFDRGDFCASPAQTYSTTADSEFVVVHLSSGSATYRLDMLTGTGPGSPTYVAGTTRTRAGGTWAQGSGQTLPQSAPNAGASSCGATPCKIELQDAQVRTPPVYRGGSIFYAQTIGLPAGTLTHTAVQWTQITTPTGIGVSGGRVQDTLATATNGRPWYAHPQIAVNSHGDFLLGYSQFGSSQHPSAGYSVHLAADGPGTLRDPLIFKAGEDYYHKDFGSSRNRWGDFSSAQVDPNDDLTLWTVNEYGKTRVNTDDGTTGANGSRWGTYWASVPGAYTITASTGANGSISPSGAVSVNAGASQAFTITPGACATIANVLVDGVSQGAIPTYTFTNVLATHTISATFTLNSYAITASAGANGTISPPGVTNVSCGGSQHYDITPAACYQVLDVKVDGVSVGAVTSYDFAAVSATHTIAATFAIKTYAITASAGANGSISPPGVTHVNCAGSQHYDITPASCYRVLDVKVDGVSVGAVTSYDFTSVSAAHTIAATFTIKTYNITASSGPNGSVSPAGITAVNCAASQHYDITPASCYQVLDVLVDGVSVGAVTSYDFTNVQAVHTISATFAIKTYTLTASAGANGAVSPAGITGVNCGAGQHYDITPASCYQVLDVKVDGVSVGAVTSYDFTNVQANHTIAATFDLKAYTITASSGANGSVTPAGATPVNCAGSQHYAITPNTGYHVADVLVDLVSVGALTAYDFTNVLANHTISATFAIDVFTITASAGPNGVIAPPGLTNVNYGAGQGYTITPDPGFGVMDVLVDGVSVGAVLGHSFTNVTANHTIAASFKDVAPPSVTVTSPNGGEAWPAGAPQNITWTATDNVGVDSVNVDYTIHGSFGPWLPVQHGIANSGTLSWLVPPPATDSALVRVSAFDHQLNQASDQSNNLFRITTTTGVAGNGRAVFALYRPSPNPSSEAVNLRFSLARGGSASLTILGVGGNVVWRRDLSGLAAGEHSVAWNGRNDAGGRTPTGLYFVRLQSEGKLKTTSLVRLP